MALRRAQAAQLASASKDSIEHDFSVFSTDNIVVFYNMHISEVAEILLCLLLQVFRQKRKIEYDFDRK